MSSSTSSRDQLVDHIKFSYTFDQTMQWSTLDSSLNARIYSAYNQTFSPSDIKSAGNDSEQYAKMQYMYQMYEYFKLDSVNLEYIPRYRSGQDAIFLNTQLELLNLNQPEPTPPAPEWSVIAGGYDAIYGAESEILFVPCKDDTIVRNNNPSEYWQTRMDKRSCIGMTTKRMTMSINPHTLDMIQSLDNQGSQQSNNQSNNALHAAPGSAANEWNATQPMPAPWLATKMVTNGGGGGSPGSVDYNRYMFFNGLKWYVYTPFNTFPNTRTSQTLIVAVLRWTYNFSFKDIDARALIPIATFTDRLNQTTEQQIALDRLRGKAPTEHGNEAKFLSTLGKHAADRNTDNEMDRDKIQKVLNPSGVAMASTSRQTPVSQIRSQLPVRHA